MPLLLLIRVSIIGSFTTVAQTNPPSKKNPADAMRELRLMALATTSAELGEKPSPEFPRVFGVVMDWPIEAATVTLVSFTTGDASIYSTGTFGVLGGVGHESVRTAAKACVRSSRRHYDSAIPTKDFPYPAKHHLRFYLVCYDGVRVIDADLDSVQNGKHRCSDLYMAAQRVISELRLITQSRKEERP